MKAEYKTSCGLRRSKEGRSVEIGSGHVCVGWERRATRPVLRRTRFGTFLQNAVRNLKESQIVRRMDSGAHGGCRRP
jgi:hypothetical protein